MIAGVVSVPVFAQTDTPKPTTKVTPSPTPAELDDEVDKLKEKVAETVSELKGNTEKAIGGVVQSIKGDTLVLRHNDEDRSVSLDDTLTKYYQISGTKTKDLEKSDIEKGDYIFVQGPEISSEITANAIYEDTSYTVISGKITAVDSSNYSISVISLDKVNYTLDIQTKTSQQMLNIKTLELEKIGFSKLKEGDSIHAVIKTNLENPKTTRFDAERVLIIPNEYFMQ
jgi:hypothetical protein